MIEILEGYPDDVLAISASGKISAEDYRGVLIPEAEDRLRRHETLKFIYRIGPNFESFTPGAMLEDAGFGVEHMGRFGRTALVTDVKWITEASKVFAPFFHVPFRVFEDNEFDKAREWILAEQSGD